MSTTAIHQSRGVPKVHLPMDSSRSNSRFKSTVHVQTSARDQVNRRRRVESDLSQAPPTSFNNNNNIVAYHRQSQLANPSQISSRSYHSNYPVSLSLRSTSSTSNRRSSLTEDSQSNSSYASLITVTNRARIVNSSSNQQLENSVKDVLVQSKRYSADLANLSMKNPSIQTATHHYVPVSCPLTYQNQLNQAATTILSDSSSDNTILHHLPDQNETTDKSQQSLHDERVHRSPRKGHQHLIQTRLRSASSIDEQKKISIPSIHYNIGPIEMHDDHQDENLDETKQRAIREEQKRKSNENEQVLINVDEYAKEILIHLKDREYVSRPKSDYMRKQSELTWDMRAILIDWLSEVADEYKLFSETLHLAVNFIDRFLSRMSVTKSKFQLIGTTALYLAAKCEEVYPPNASEFAYVTDNAYTKKQVLKIEDLLLQTLHFDVSTVTTHTFLLHYLKLADVDEVTSDLARYIAELTLLDPSCLQHLSSLQAAAILCLALHMRQKPPWSLKLKQTTGYTIQSFYPILEKIFWLVAKANVNDKWAITKKYRHVKHHSVASIELPPTLPYIDLNTDSSI